MKDFFLELFAYGHHYNQQLADILTASEESVTEKPVSLYSHILNAHHTWNNRIAGHTPLFGVWELHSIRDLKEIDRVNYNFSVSLLNTRELDEEMHYRNTKGLEFTNSIRDILFHIINHSTYHRGQIATEFRKTGIEPLATDYIWYKR
ncbi:MAG: damage-inducible protein DinB [Cytophagaceae bacterium SCN 52-12]|nr:MAG: damage-inducible protein DinB [Cytophagaceae bacterium SCN 52-12]